MRYLVTGGAGFIGSHLCEALLARGDEVICVDNFKDYYSPQRKRRNIARRLKTRASPRRRSPAPQPSAAACSGWREPKIAVPTRTCVAPKRIAVS